MTPDGLRLSHGIKMVLTARALTFLISYIGFNTGQGNRFTKLRKMWSYVGLMEPVLLEIERAMAAGLWYAAVALSLTLPDICASLEARPEARPDGQKARYKSWFNKNLAGKIGLSADECWALRSGVVHQGRYSNKSLRSYHRVAFTFENYGVHCITVETNNERILSLHAPIFCADIISSVRAWCVLNSANQTIQRNLAHVVQIRPNGFSPAIRGLNIIM